MGLVGFGVFFFFGICPFQRGRNGGGFGNSGEDFPADKREDLASPDFPRIGNGIFPGLGMEFVEFSRPFWNFRHLRATRWGRAAVPGGNPVPPERLWIADGLFLE